eukprot:Sspe_Gene.76834::Locus_47991_Transcript_2_5_Confidence_0.444_Length_8795::g.76834::m.76834
MGYPGDDLLPEAEVQYDEPVALPRHTRTKGSACRISNNDLHNWSDQITKLVEEDQKMLVLLTSPPGVGKTYLLRSLADSLQFAFFHLDCSDACLVNETMIDYLSRTLPFGSKGPSDGSRCVLCCDEYHMLRTTEQKMELMNWVRPRLSWLKVLLVGNRTDDYDINMMAEFRKDTAMGPYVRIIEARLVTTYVQRVYKVQFSKERLDTMCHLLLCLRLLFGDEAVSLRLKTMFDGDVGDDVIQENCCRQLGHKLQRFGREAPLAFVENFFEFRKTVWGKGGIAREREFIKALSKAQDGMQLLVYSAAMTYLLGKGDAAQSFAEFVVSEQCGAYHPVVRLFLFAQYLWDVAALESAIDEATRKSAFGVLQRMHLSDQTGFPVVKVLCDEVVPLSTGRAIAAQGDFRDLEWMGDALAHGEQFNWDEVATVWEEHRVTDISGLGTILRRVGRVGQGRVLTALHPENLAQLLQHRFADSLREAVIASYPPDRLVKELRVPHSPWMACVWEKVKNQPLQDWEKDPSKVLREVSAHLKNLKMDRLVQPFKQDMPQMAVLLWASENATSNNVPNADERTQCLQRMLIKESDDLNNKGQGTDEEKQELLEHVWNDLFHPMLAVRTPRDPGVPLVVVEGIVRRVPANHPLQQWSPLIKLVHRAAHRMPFSLTQACQLMDGLHLEKWSDEDLKAMPPCVVATLMQTHEPGCLSLLPVTQVAMLLRAPVSVDEWVERDGHVVIRKNLEKAVGSEKTKEHIRIKNGVGRMLQEQWEYMNH